MAEFRIEMQNAQTSPQSENDWGTTAASEAYKPGIQPVFDNGSRVVVGKDEVPRITVTPGLLMEMGPTGKGLQPGDLIIVGKQPEKA